MCTDNKIEPNTDFGLYRRVDVPIKRSNRENVQYRKRLPTQSRTILHLSRKGMMVRFTKSNDMQVVRTDEISTNI